MTQRSAPGYIGPSLMVHGRLTGQGELAIDGRVEGDLHVEGEIHLGPSGVVLASVQAEVVSVAGHLRGNVLATSEVCVRDGGRIEGDVRAPRVSIDDGGALHGGIEMDFDLPSREGD